MYGLARPSNSISRSADQHVGATSQVKAMCERLLANPVIEGYRVEIGR